jgi:uncharacterized protein YdiU (UPF0061 family)
MKQLSEVTFQNRFTEHFPGDRSYLKGSRTTPGVLYSLVNPATVTKPTLMALSEDLASYLNLKTPLNNRDIELLAGNQLPIGGTPYAACYGGHQFGHWAGQLGDGRAINLGEIADRNGQLWEVQLKGSGKTPYSRNADGLAVMRSSVREFLMSEAMAHLGVPTTRALSLVSTGESVLRDMFYSGDPRHEPGAIVCRLAPSFLRFGNYQILAARGELTQLEDLVTYTIKHHFPVIDQEDPRKVLKFFVAVCDRTLDLMVAWYRIGFVHGVMNTDNMSILGLTIDYGPYSMLDRFDPNFTPNTTDLPGRRYAFGKQGSIALWNLTRLMEALIPLKTDQKAMTEYLESYSDKFADRFEGMMLAKLGLPNDKSRIDGQNLIQSALPLIYETQMDYTLCFQSLIEIRRKPSLDLDSAITSLENSSYKEFSPKAKDGWQQFLTNYFQYIGADQWSDESLLARMQSSNPCFILRNYALFQAIEEMNQGNNAAFAQLFQALQKPYEKIGKNSLYQKAPDWAFSTPGCSALSCSS